MIDSEGYRPNVGIVICNRRGQLLWAKRIRQSAWQFPQGGINEDETIEQALFRELEEEVGLAGRMSVSCIRLPNGSVMTYRRIIFVTTRTLFALAKNRNGFCWDSKRMTVKLNWTNLESLNSTTGDG